jgi:Prophage antirepressor
MTNTNQLTIFTFKNHTIRTGMKDNLPFFCLIDICNVLDIKNRRQLRQRLNPRGICSIPTPTSGGIQKSYFVNESNLYRAILRSDKIEAVEFEDWICDEVLPAIRKDGYYINDKIIEVQKHKRKLPTVTVKKELFLSEKEHKAIGGIVKACAAVGVKEALDSKNLPLFHNSGVIAVPEPILKYIHTELGNLDPTINKLGQFITACMKQAFKEMTR